jgi:hypothetical protein
LRIQAELIVSRRFNRTSPRWTSNSEYAAFLGVEFLGASSFSLSIANGEERGGTVDLRM